jgi:hypothetical protein
VFLKSHRHPDRLTVPPGEQIHRLTVAHVGYDSIYVLIGSDGLLPHLHDDVSRAQAGHICG